MEKINIVNIVNKIVILFSIAFVSCEDNRQNSDLEIRQAKELSKLQNELSNAKILITQYEDIQSSETKDLIESIKYLHESEVTLKMDLAERVEVLKKIENDFIKRKHEAYLADEEFKKSMETFDPEWAMSSAEDSTRRIRNYVKSLEVELKLAKEKK